MNVPSKNRLYIMPPMITCLKAFLFIDAILLFLEGPSGNVPSVLYLVMSSYQGFFLGPSSMVKTSKGSMLDPIVAGSVKRLTIKACCSSLISIGAGEAAKAMASACRKPDKLYIKFLKSCSKSIQKLLVRF